MSISSIPQSSTIWHPVAFYTGVLAGRTQTIAQISSEDNKLNLFQAPFTNIVKSGRWINLYSLRHATANGNVVAVEAESWTTSENNQLQIYASSNDDKTLKLRSFRPFDNTQIPKTQFHICNVSLSPNGQTLAVMSTDCSWSRILRLYSMKDIFDVYRFPFCIWSSIHQTQPFKKTGKDEYAKKVPSNRKSVEPFQEILVESMVGAEVQLGENNLLVKGTYSNDSHSNYVPRVTNYILNRDTSRYEFHSNVVGERHSKIISSHDAASFGFVKDFDANVEGVLYNAPIFQDDPIEPKYFSTSIDNKEYFSDATILKDSLFILSRQLFSHLNGSSVYEHDLKNEKTQKILSFPDQDSKHPICYVSDINAFEHENKKHLIVWGRAPYQSKKPDEQFYVARIFRENKSDEPIPIESIAPPAKVNLNKARPFTPYDCSIL